MPPPHPPLHRNFPHTTRLPLLRRALTIQHCYPRLMNAFPTIYPTKRGQILPGGAPCCSLKHIWKSLRRRLDATRTSSILAVVPGLHTFCSHDSIFHHYSTHFWDLLRAQTIPRRVPGSHWCGCRSIRRDLSQRPQECDWRAICQCATLPCSNAIISRSGDFQSHPCCQSWVLHMYHYFSASHMSITIAIHQEHSNLSWAVYEQHRLYQPNLNSNSNPTPPLSRIKFLVIRWYRRHRGAFVLIPVVTRPQPRPRFSYPDHAQAYPALVFFFKGTWGATWLQIRG
jgi:hypothetical protein